MLVEQWSACEVSGTLFLLGTGSASLALAIDCRGTANFIPSVACHALVRQVQEQEATSPSPIGTPLRKRRSETPNSHLLHQDAPNGLLATDDESTACWMHTRVSQRSWSWGPASTHPSAESPNRWSPNAL